MPSPMLTSTLAVRRLMMLARTFVARRLLIAWSRVTHSSVVGEKSAKKIHTEDH